MVELKNGAGADGAGKAPLLGPLEDDLDAADDADQDDSGLGEKKVEKF